MKKSKILIPLLAFTLSLSTLTACMGNQPVSFTPYWVSDSQTEENVTQELSYDVTFQSQSSIVNYTVGYANGKYVTSLTMEKVEGTNAYVYRYKTNFSIDTVYTYKGTDSETFHDVVTTDVTFRTTKNMLKPISSTKVIQASYPINANDASDIKECYNTTNNKIETKYNENCTSGESVVTYFNDKNEPISQTKKFSIDDKLTYLDNEQLLFAISGIDPNYSQNSNFSVYAPFTATVQTIAVDFSKIQTDEFSFALNGTAGKHSIGYYPVSIKINARENSGAAQTAWYASHTASKEFRNILLKLETPISYNLGKLIYTLTSVNFTN